MKWMLVFTLLLSSYAWSSAQDEQLDGQLEQMVRENVISPKEAQKAKLRLMTKKKNGTFVSRTPASVTPLNTIEETSPNDLDGAQFKQILDEARKIVPLYKN